MKRFSAERKFRDLFSPSELYWSLVSDSFRALLNMLAKKLRCFLCCSLLQVLWGDLSLISPCSACGRLMV